MIAVYRSFTRAGCLCLAAGWLAWTPALPAQSEVQPPPRGKSPHRILADEPVPKADPESELRDLRRTGERAYRDGRYAVAEDQFRRLWEGATAEELLVDATTLLVKALLAQDKSDDALALLNRLAERTAALHAAASGARLTGLSPASQVVVQYWEGRVLLLRGDPDEAAKRFAPVAANTVSPYYKARGHLGLAECYMIARQWSKAEDSFRTARNLTLDDEVERAVGLGLLRALVAQGKYNEAEALFKTAWEEADAAYRHDLGLLHVATLLASGQTAAAWKFYQEQSTAAPAAPLTVDQYDTIRKLAQTLVHNQQAADALPVYQRLLEQVRSDAQKQQVLLELAEAAAAANQRELALHEYQVFADLYPHEPRRPQVLLAMGRLQETAGKVDDATALYQQVQADAQAAPTWRFGAADRLANLALVKQDYVQARAQWLAAAKEEVPGDQRAASLFQAAQVCYQSLKDFNAAAQYYEQVATQYPKAVVAEPARYGQGLARQQEKRYDLAAKAFAAFVQEFPASKQVPSALLQQGSALRLAGDYAGAILILRQHGTRFPADPDAPKALLEASQAANAASQGDDAIGFLNTIITKYAGSSYFPRALYERAYLRLAYGYAPDALLDCAAFLKDYKDSNPDLAADMYLWLGDHYASLAFSGQNEAANYAQAEKYFLEVATLQKDSPDAPLALYEAAKNAYYRQDFAKVDLYLAQLDKSYPNATFRVQARAKFLRADIATFRDDFKGAAELFEVSANLVPRSEFYYAAKGRRAECFYTLAGKNEDPAEAAKQYDQALVDLRLIVETEGVPKSLQEMARYRMGKVFEKRKQPDKAIEQYYAIFYKYVNAVDKGQITDWFYFARAGFDLARLYVEANQYMSAIAVYENLSSSGIPVAPDAARRAEELKKQYQ